MIRYKAYRYRIYPNCEQEIFFEKTFGCTRFIWNKMLSDKISYYKETGKMLYNTPAQYKKEFPFLSEVDSAALSNVQMQLMKAYKKFFHNKNIGYPKFKRKHSCKKSYTTNRHTSRKNIEVFENGIKLPKVGLVKAKIHREIPPEYRIKAVTITKEKCGKYYASVMTEYELNFVNKELDVSTAIGLDYSSPHFFIDSDGNSADMPHWYRKSELKISREQRKLSRMVKGSSNYKKEKLKIARLQDHVSNQRKDWQHKLSYSIANTHDIVCIESINYQELAQTLNFGKSTNDNAFGQFRNFLSYKLEERGKRLIMIDKWYPSSKTCCNCGYINKNLKLSDRSWVCDNCGETNDRDINAAINILNCGLSYL